MDVRSLLTVPEVAVQLGVNRQKVLAFIAEGRLPATKIGGDWWVSVVDATRFALVERRPGRPLSAVGAWELLRAGEQESRVRVRRSRVGLDAFQVVHLVRGRAEVHRFHVLDRLCGDVADQLIAGGESAARPHGFAPHGAKKFCDGYVRRSAIALLTDRFALVPATAEEINVWLREVDDEVWPFDDTTTSVGPLVAAIDMLGNPIDDRSIDAARPIVERYLS